MQHQHPFDALLQREIPSLRRRAVQLARNDQLAQDLVQETLMKAWEHRNRYQSDSCLRAWLFTILRNTFLSDLRKRRREVEDVEGHFASALWIAPSQDHAVALKEVTGLLRRLPAAQSRALVMMGAAGFTQAETATACACSLGAVKSRVSRGRATLTAWTEAA